MANLFNDGQIEDLDTYEWMICDPSHVRFGKAVGEDIIQGGVTLGDSGIVELDGEEVHLKRIATLQKADFILRIDPSRGDERLLGLFKDQQGKRFLDFKTAMTLMKETEATDWFLQGPRVFLELMRAIRPLDLGLVTSQLTISIGSRAAG